jgi:ABC-type sugar transport system permease subunit
MLVGLIWIYTGFFTVILLAGVDGIPRDYFEASEVARLAPIPLT